MSGRARHLGGLVARPTTSAHASAAPQSAAAALMAMGTGAELFLAFSASLQH
jgi:hypothetical protein